MLLSSYFQRMFFLLPALFLFSCSSDEEPAQRRGRGIEKAALKSSQEQIQDQVSTSSRPAEPKKVKVEEAEAEDKAEDEDEDEAEEDKQVKPSSCDFNSIPILTNGSWPGNTSLNVDLGKTVAGTCQTGFTGTPSVVCQDSGVWSQITGTCVADSPGTPSVPCAASSLPLLSNGTWPTSPAEQSIGQTINGTCNSGFTGTPTVTCKADGWDTLVGSCIASTPTSGPIEASTPTSGPIEGPFTLRVKKSCSLGSSETDNSVTFSIKWSADVAITRTLVPANSDIETVCSSTPGDPVEIYSELDMVFPLDISAATEVVINKNGSNGFLLHEISLFNANGFGLYVGPQPWLDNDGVYEDELTAKPLIVNNGVLPDRSYTIIVVPQNITNAESTDTMFVSLGGSNYSRAFLVSLPPNRTGQAETTISNVYDLGLGSLDPSTIKLYINDSDGSSGYDGVSITTIQIRDDSSGSAGGRHGWICSAGFTLDDLSGATLTNVFSSSQCFLASSL